MSKHQRTLLEILSGTHDKSLGFSDVCSLLSRIGFNHRQNGSHHIFTMKGVEEILNLQTKDGYCKPYQVKQVREVIVKYKLAEYA